MNTKGNLIDNTASDPTMRCPHLTVVWVLVLGFASWGFTFGWPPLEDMLVQSGAWQHLCGDSASDSDLCPERQLHLNALYAVSSASVDLGGLAGGFLIKALRLRCTRPLTVVVLLAGLGLVASMALCALALWYNNNLLYLGLPLQALSGMTVFQASLNLQHAFPSSRLLVPAVVMAAFICAFNSGGAVPQWLQAVFFARGVGLPSIFWGLAIFYSAMTLGAVLLWPPSPLKAAATPFHESHGARPRSFSTSPLFYVLTTVTAVVGVHIKFYLGYWDDIARAKAHSEHELRLADKFAAVFYAYLPVFIVAAMLSTMLVLGLALRRQTKHGLLLNDENKPPPEERPLLQCLLVVVLLATYVAFSNATLPLVLQPPSMFLEPLVWVALYTVCLRLLDVAFPSEVESAFGVLIFVQGVAMLSLLGFSILGHHDGFALPNIVFGALNLLCALGLILALCLDRRRWLVCNFANDIADAK